MYVYGTLSDRGDGLRRKDKEIKDPKIIQNILKENTICRIALSDRDEPYIVSMNYGYDGESIYLHCAPEGRKMDIMKRNNRICLEITDSTKLKGSEKACNFSTKYRSVIGFGFVAEITGYAEKEAGLQIIMQQQTGIKGWSFADKDINNIAVLKITFDTVSGKENV